LVTLDAVFEPHDGGQVEPEGGQEVYERARLVQAQGGEGAPEGFDDPLGAQRQESPRRLVGQFPVERVPHVEGRLIAFHDLPEEVAVLLLHQHPQAVGDAAVVVVERLGLGGTFHALQLGRDDLDEAVKVGAVGGLNLLHEQRLEGRPPDILGRHAGHGDGEERELLLGPPQQREHRALLVHPGALLHVERLACEQDDRRVGAADGGVDFVPKLIARPQPAVAVRLEPGVLQARLKLVQDELVFVLVGAVADENFCRV
jgi:hypothetical protein